MRRKSLSKLIALTIVTLLINALVFQVSLAVPGSVTTLFEHDGRQFHGNMFDVNVITPLRITSFDVNIGLGNTTVTVYYRNGSYVGSETNPGAWTVLGSANVSGAGQNQRTSVMVSSPVLQPGTYGFYITVTPTFELGQSVDMYYTSGSRTVGTADISLNAGIGVGGLFGDPAACAHWSRNLPNNPCIFPDRSWNGTVYYDTQVAPIITSGAPGNGTVGVAYNHSFSANGNTPISYSVTDGALPPGLTLSGDGVISGTPTTAGTYSGTISATNGVAPDAAQGFNITIVSPTTAPSITSGAPGNGTVGAAYTHTYTASGTTPINYTVTAGALPAGLTLSGGVISGTPTTAGTFTGTVTASNGTAPDASQNFNIIIAEAATAPSITSGAPANGTVGAAYTHTYTASGTTPINYTVTAGALPAGLTLSGGVISGTPTTAGTFTGTVTASNGTAPDATQDFNITISVATAAPTITSAAPANGTAGTAYTHTYTATGTTPISFSVTAGALPPGLTLATDGTLSGTPTTAGTYTGTVTAANGTAPDATQDFNITIAGAATAPSITSAAPGNGTAGAAYNHTYTASGTTPITYTVTAGALPTGLTLSTAGVISGTPTAAGTYTGTVTASNGTAPDATQAFSITISAPPPVSGTGLTTLFAHDGRQFHGNMFNVTVINPLRITAFDVNIGVGNTTVTVYYRNGSYAGSEANPAAWTLMGSANVSGSGQNERTRVNVISPLLQPGTYGFYVTVTPTFELGQSVDMYYTGGSLNVGNADLSIATGNGVGGLFGDPAACAHWSRGYTNNPCIFPDRSWNGTIYYEAIAAPSITSAAPGNGTVGTAYNHSYAATGTAPISYSVTAGVLPAGLTLSTAGVISGTPTTAGTFTGTVTASNGTAPDATQDFNITIAAAGIAPSITSSSPVNGTVGAAYTHTYTATGTTPITYTVATGNLPPGLTLSSGGVISGTPTTAGTYSGTVSASNGIAPNATQGFTITIAAATAAPVITSLPPGSWVVGAVYSHTYTATGTAPITYSVTAGALPPGLTLSTAGVISGTPTTVGTYSGTVTASNGLSPDGTQAFNITITEAYSGPGITTLFAHDNRQFHGNMFDVTVINPLSVTAFDVNMGLGNTTVTVYYRNGSYLGSETNPAAWTLMGIANVSGEGQNERTRVNISSPVLQPGTYGFYVTVTPTFELGQSVDLYYSVGSRTVGNADIVINTGNGVGGNFGDPAACAHWSRNYPNNPCLFPERTWNGTIFYQTAVSAAPTITSAAPGDGTVGLAYNYSYAASGTTPISYSVTAGALPPGLTLSSGGVISGTPTTAGTYTGTVTATNGINPNATQNFSITILTTTIAPTITSAAPANGSVGAGYSHTYTASGTTPITYAVTAGALPPGLTLSSGGVISGTPTATGTYTGTVTASNGTAPNATQNFSIVINGLTIAPVITSVPPGTGTVGIGYNHTFTATGTAPITYAVTAGMLPPGLTLSSAGVISGTPTASGAFEATVTASNGATPNGTQNFTLTVTPPYTGPGITTLFSHDNRQFHGNMFDVTVVNALSITSFDVNLTWGSTTVTIYYRNGSYVGSETNPGAWTLLGIANVSSDGPNNRTSVPISSPVLQPGTYGFYVSVTPTFQIGQTSDLHYSVGSRTVSNPDISITTGNGVGGNFGDPAACAHPSRGYPNNPCLFPDRSWNGTIYYQTVNQTTTAPSITSSAPANGTRNVAYNHTYTATGTTPITFSVTSGSLPPGLTLSTAGVISGTPTTGGTYTGTVTASNGTAPNATQNFSITIVVPAVAPTITSAAPANGTVGTAYNHSYTASGTTPITYSVTSGSLPPGLTLSTAGVISGTPTTGGTFTGTVTASNGTAPNATQNFSITVVVPTVAPTITSGNPPNGNRNVAYSFTFTATGTAPITFSVTSGSLPPGLTLSTAGVLSGTPTTTGTYTATVTASNGTAPNATRSITIVISNVAPTITSAAPANGNRGIAYTHTFTANGTPTITFSRTSGTLPPGLTLSSAGVLSGTPTTNGTYTATVTATNGTSPNATQTFTIVISNRAPTITSAAPANGTRNVAYTHTFTATGSPTITFSRTSGTLPPGLTLSSAGVLSGTPTTAGTYTATVRASNGTSPNATQTFTIVISAVAPTITSSAPPNGTRNVAYNHNFTANGTPTITFSRTSGTLPPGLSLSSAGVLSGTPTTNGTYTATVTATNGLSPNATQTFTIVISGVPPQITSGDPPNGTRNVAYSTFTFTASGTTPITYSVTSGTMPPGLTLSSAGVISGTPTTSGSYPVTVTASNGTPPNATRSFTIVISNIAPIITSSNPPNGSRNVAYSYSFTASGTTPITYSVTSGSLPPGLTMNSAGVISGTPTTDGGYNATVTASNGGIPDATRSFTIVITSTPPSITSSNPVNGSRGVAYSHTFTANGTPTITFSRTSGTLPPGLTLSSAGVLSGTPTTNGTYTATVTASNGSSPSATQTFTIVISNLAPTITSAAPPNGRWLSSYSFTFTATGSPTITFTRASGTLPPGLSLSSAGVLRGRPTSTGTYTFTVRASNGTSPDATRTVTIVISLL